MMRIATAIIVLLLFGITQPLLAQGDPKAGKSKSELCQGCHGPDGNSMAPNFPKLAGQKSGYIVKQIKDFQRGHRVNETMTGMAATVTSVGDLKDIAAYFSSQKMKKNNGSFNSSLVQQGKKIFLKGTTKGVYGCVNCHGKNGKGKAPQNHVFPVIGGQHKQYLVKQLKDFKKGERANDPAGMMGDIAAKLTDKEIEAVAEYLATL